METSEFIRIFCERPKAFAWFLGAGTSRNAGLPTAEDIINDLKRRYYCSEENQEFSTKDLQNAAVRRTVETFLKSRGFPERWAPEEYSTYFQTIFADDRERQRKYIEGMLSEKRVRLAVGNRVFGALVAEGLARVTFTTNFDTVVEKSVAAIADQSLSAFHLEGASGANNAINNEEYPFYCKLHGDFRHQSIKNLEADLLSQNESLSSCLLNAANRFGFVFAGYSGRDQSIMDLLHNALGTQNPFPHGIYWLTMKGSSLPQQVAGFIEAANQQGIRAESVEIDTFDTLMLSLWRNLTEKSDETDKKVRKGRVAPVSIAIPSSEGNRPLLRYNALPLSDIPSECLFVELTKSPTWESVGPLLRETEHNLVTTIDGTLMAWGEASEAQRVFENDFVGTSVGSFEADWRKTEKLQVKRFLEDGLSKAFTRVRPLLSRRNRMGAVLIVDQMAQDVGIFEHLHSLVGKTTGVVPNVTVPATDTQEAVLKVEYAESLQFNFSWADNRLWLLIKPDIWIWPPRARRHATQWLDQKKANRKNDVYNSLVSAWVSILTDDADSATDVTLSAYEGNPSPSNPSFTFSSRTGYSKRRIR